MKTNIKSDGRIHYTGVHAKDRDGVDIFINEWADAGKWEWMELEDEEVIIGVHGYIHMDWQIIHLGLLIV